MVGRARHDRPGGVNAGEGLQAMTLNRQLAFWGVTFLVFIVVLWLLREILLPFVAGLVLAYLFDPLANRLERLGLSRALATMTIVGAFVIFAVFLAVLLVPILVGQLAGLVENLPGYASRVQSIVADPSRPWLAKMLGVGLGEGDLGDLVKQATGGLALFLRSLWTGGQALVSLFSLLLVTPVVAFYLIWDWNRMVATIDQWLPRRQAATIRSLAREINTAIAGFVRGQTSICLILASFYAAGFTVMGLRYGLLIGLATGLASFVPYVGTLTGLVVALSVAVAQFWPEWTPVAAVLAICLVLQFVEGYVLAPNLVGRVVGLHPVWLMFALFTFGYLLGFVGLLIAVPLAASLGVLVRFALQRYLASPLYTGEETRVS
jgi:predicted PurR-regulated permease PerM